MLRYSKTALRSVDVAPDGRLISLKLKTAEGVIELEFDLSRLRRSVRYMWIAVRAAEELKDNHKQPTQH
jgi:hypothetical protein